MKNNNQNYCNQKNERNEDKLLEAWKGAFLAFTEMGRP